MGKVITLETPLISKVTKSAFFIYHPSSSKLVPLLHKENRPEWVKIINVEHAHKGAGRKVTLNIDEGRRALFVVYHYWSAKTGGAHWEYLYFDGNTQQKLVEIVKKNTGSILVEGTTTLQELAMAGVKPTSAEEVAKFLIKKFGLQLDDWVLGKNGNGGKVRGTVKAEVEPPSFIDVIPSEEKTEVKVTVTATASGRALEEVLAEKRAEKEQKEKEVEEEKVPIYRAQINGVEVAFEFFPRGFIVTYDLPSPADKDRNTAWGRKLIDAAEKTREFLKEKLAGVPVAYSVFLTTKPCDVVLRTCEEACKIFYSIAGVYPRIVAIPISGGQLVVFKKLAISQIERELREIKSRVEKLEEALRQGEEIRKIREKIRRVMKRIQKLERAVKETVPEVKEKVDEIKVLVEEFYRKL